MADVGVGAVAVFVLLDSGKETEVMAGYDDVLDSGAVDFDGAFDWYAAVEEI